MNAGKASREDEEMLLAIQVARAKMDGHFYEWLEHTIEMNTDSLMELICALMDAAVVVRQRDFEQQVHNFINSGRFESVVGATEVTLS